jgi:transcriptional regulator with XRE-family HTH domain
MDSMLHERLVELRQYKNLKQYEVAEKVGVNRSTYGGYERGERIPDAYTLSRIADFFHVTTDFIIGRDHYSSTIPNELLEIVNYIPPDKQHEFWNDLIKYARFLRNKD